MSWFLVPSVVHPFAGDTGTPPAPFAYLLGEGGSEDAGLYCFYDGDSEKWIISSQLFPTFGVFGGTLYPAAYTYNGEPVWVGGSEGNSYYLFHSVTEDAYILMKGALAEPNYVEGFSETGHHEASTQDSFWIAPSVLPSVPASGEWGFTAGRAGLNDLTVQVSIGERWERVNRGSRDNDSHPFCGFYYSSGQRGYRTVGNPVFAADIEAAAAVGEERFVLSPDVDSTGHYVLEGEAFGWVVRYFASRSAYCIGEPSTTPGAAWWESASVPLARDPSSNELRATFRSKSVDENGDVVAGSAGNVNLRYIGRILGRARKSVLLGDVSIWR